MGTRVNGGEIRREKAGGRGGGEGGVWGGRGRSELRVAGVYTGKRGVDT